MEAELTSLDSQLERAKLAHAARCNRLAAGKTSETEASPLSKRVLFPDESGLGSHHPTLDADLRAGKTDRWTPQLDLSQETEVNKSIARCCGCFGCSHSSASRSIMRGYHSEIYLNMRYPSCPFGRLWFCRRTTNDPSCAKLARSNVRTRACTPITCEESGTGTRPFCQCVYSK